MKKIEIWVEPHTPSDPARPCYECVFNFDPCCLKRSACEFKKTGKTWRLVKEEDIPVQKAMKDFEMRDSIEVMQSKVDAFNESNPVGSSVTVIKDLGEKIETTVRHPAEILSGHTAVVWLKGISGCYSLDRVVG